MIRRETYASYSEALDVVQDASVAKAKGILSRWALAGGTLSTGEVAAQLTELVSQYGAIARTVANEFCRQVLADNGITTFSAAEAARSGVASLVREMGSAHGSVAKLAQAVGKVVMQSADSQVIANANSSTSRCWAVVASPGACEWCLMQSSRGWVFKSSQTANNVRHANCRCKVVMDVGAVGSLLGYDPDQLREEWADERQARLEREAERAAKKAAE